SLATDGSNADTVRRTSSQATGDILLATPPTLLTSDFFVPGDTMLSSCVTEIGLKNTKSENR
ncbi:hypothetical protein KPB00_36340, partial [Burkholderia cenocepacia]|uniref:hypothetical protein n=1 Tax=Burkholderia cenocepacia TaxID=95486 RepID=UPI0028603411